jgi:nitrous oxidase accessory protein NosD
MSYASILTTRKSWLVTSRPLKTLCLTSFLGFTASALAATVCVNASGAGGCHKTITAGVAAANPGDTVTVAPGWYQEDVIIGKPISLIGANKSTTFLSAKGLPNGIYIDGLDSPTPLSHVTVSGFSIFHAKYEGILAQNVSNVTISGNLVYENDLALNVSAAECPGLPAFETNESADCGEGIHLMGVDHSLVYDNESNLNSGGILITDETATTHDNVISTNSVHDNPYACGITLASHPGYVKTGKPPLAFGIFHNTVANNHSSSNGLGIPGGGAGIGLFAPGPGNINIDNSVVNNRVESNSLPGIAIHNHVNLTFPNHPPNPNVNDNTITGNYIADNGPDPSLPTTLHTGISILGTTPITGLVIADNTFAVEDIDVAMNSASLIDIHLNNFSGQKAGIDNLNTAGTVNATQNWWGCAAGPGNAGCTNVLGGSTVVATPWLLAPLD